MEFLKNEDGSGTVELVLLIAAFVAFALIFNQHIDKFVSKNVETVLTVEYNADMFPD